MRSQKRHCSICTWLARNIEHLDPSLRPFSLVLSTYDDGSGIGTVGVIGPTRMRYSRAIAAVDGAAQAVSRVLRDPN